MPPLHLNRDIIGISALVFTIVTTLNGSISPIPRYDNAINTFFVVCIIAGGLAILLALIELIVRTINQDVVACLIIVAILVRGECVAINRAYTLHPPLPCFHKL